MDVKNIFAKNLNHYMKVNGKTRRDLCSVLGVSYSAVTAWINGQKYPRMDKVDDMAKYFGISRSDLIEEKRPEVLEALNEKQDFIVNVIVRLQSDEDFYSFIEDIMDLEPEKIPVLSQMLASLHILAK